MLKIFELVRRVVVVFAVCLAGAFDAGAQSPRPVVVQPFDNLSGQPGDDWIGLGIAETLVGDLQNAGLAVVGVETDIKGAKPWSIRGSFQRVGEQLRVIIRVVDTTSDTVHYTTRIDGAFADLFAVQDQIGAELAARLTAPASTAVAPGAGSSGAEPQLPFRPAEARAIAPSNGATGRLALGDEPPAAVPGTGFASGRRGTAGFAASPVRPRPIAVVSRVSEPPRIDGRLDDSVWETATHITDFIQIAPVEGAPASEDTEVWIAYDNDHMYFAFYAHYTDPAIMRVNRADREEIRGDDRMSVLFDTFLDQQRAYQFEVNGYGVQADSLVNADGSTGFSRSGGSSSATRTSGTRRGGGSGLGNSGQFGIRGDQSWDALFDTSGQIVEDGWTAEMRIPFKSLRYPSRASGDVHQWGFQITRVIRGKSEAQSWSPISRGVAGQLTQFGQLDGLASLSQSRNLEILPEVTGVRFGSLDSDSGVYDPGDPIGELGLGFKYGLTPNLTADMTFNPDFSQIEADRPQVATNQRFPLFFSEQRPFFLEGQEIFQTATPLTLVHTRTVIDPRLGAKLTGKVGQTTLGVMVADDEAAGRLDDVDDSRFGSSAQTIIGRARFDLYSESYLGAIVTAREFDEDYNRVAGVDGRFRLGRTHRMSFLAVGSQTQASELTDAPGQKLTGQVFEADFARQGRNLNYSAAYSSISPDFETNTGFLPRVDLRQMTGTLGYRWWPESSLLTWGPSLTYLRLYDHTGVLQDEQISGQGSFSFRNNMSITGTVNRDLERFQEIDFRKTGYGFFGVISSRVVSIYGGYNWGDGVFFDTINPFLGQSTIGNVNFRLQITSRLRNDFTMVSSNFVDPLDDTEVFDVKIFRSRTTYQFTNRLLLRHILEHNTQSVTLGNNVLMTYRINAGTVVFVGYDDRYQNGPRINDSVFSLQRYERTNRAFFGKISYLFRY